MNRFSVVVAFVMFTLGAVAGQSMVSPVSIPAEAKAQSISTFDLQRNAPVLLPAQSYDAV